METHFHIITIKDPLLELALISFRHAVDPCYTSVPHITVGGPFNSYHKPQECPEEGYEIGLSASAGTFHHGDFHVAYLRVHAPDLQKIWNKPDFQDSFIPHLTLYAGPSEVVCNKVVSLIDTGNPEVVYKFRINLIENHRKLAKANKEQENWFLRSVVKPDEFEISAQLGRIVDYIKEKLTSPCSLN